MNNSSSKEAVEATIIPAYSKEEIIILLQKAQNDYNLIDNNINKVLSSDNTDIESMGNVDKKLKEANIVLIECTRIRNEKINELLNIIKKQF